ncbi:MAG: hypothetical protein LBT12_03745, partial [Oscillospiraceae bacterium]|nr:hypothetical protein [Oscillospiraceae bacterium]
MDVAGEQSRALELDKLERSLPEDAEELLDGMSVFDGLDGGGAIARLLSGVTGRLREIVTGALKNAAVILTAALLCGTVSAAFPEKSGNYATLAGVLTIAAVSAGNIHAFIGLGANVMDELNTFSKMLLPTLTAAAAAGGAITSAAAKYAATALFLNILMTAAKNIVMPLIYAYAAVSIADAAMGNGTLAGASSLIKWLAKTSLTVIVLLFTAYLSLVSVISGASDAVALRA